MSALDMVLDKCCITGCEKTADYAIGTEGTFAGLPVISGFVYCFEHATNVGEQIEPDTLVAKPIRRFWEKMG